MNIIVPAPTLGSGKPFHDKKKLRIKGDSVSNVNQQRTISKFVSRT